MPELSASRAALLSLRRDRRVVEEGHRFLEEKRVALAHELLRRAAAYGALKAAFQTRAEQARRAFADAVGRHGLEGLQVYPPLVLGDGALEAQETLFLGLRLVSGARLRLAGTADTPAPWRTAEGARCAEAFRALAAEAAALAAAASSLLRLMREYRRTERRVKALENIVLPEARQVERRFETALEELDQEEVMRSRLFAGEPLDR